MNRRILMVLAALFVVGFAFCNGGIIKKLGDKITGNEPPPVEKAENQCPVCKGEGKVPCPRCNGTGRVEAYGGVPCGQCSGTGKVRCEKCAGRGKKIQ